jgi:hypothetical protein
MASPQEMQAAALRDPGLLDSIISGIQGLVGSNSDGSAQGAPGILEARKAYSVYLSQGPVPELSFEDWLAAGQPAN